MKIEYHNSKGELFSLVMAVVIAAVGVLLVKQLGAIGDLPADGAASLLEKIETSQTEAGEEASDRARTARRKRDCQPVRRSPRRCNKANPGIGRSLENPCRGHRPYTSAQSSRHHRDNRPCRAGIGHRCKACGTSEDLWDCQDRFGRLSPGTRRNRCRR